jgi:nuclease-like protein
MPGALLRPEHLPSRIRNDPNRSAEVKLYDALTLQMGPGWVVFYSVAWTAPARGATPRDGETDFIVASPNKGVLLIEVKGGRIRFDERRRQWISKDRKDDDHDIDPFEQVKRSKYALGDKLKGLSSLRNRQIELSHAVAFPDVDRPRYAVTPDAPPELIIGAEDLHRLPARINEILGYTVQGTTRHVENGELLVRELTRLMGQSTVLPNPLAIEIADEDREIVQLTEGQFNVLDVLSRTRRAAIGGCAGSSRS